MTIKQQGGIFGRNPKFNEVEVTSLGVGTNAPEADIHVYDSFPEVRLQDSDNTNDFTRFYHSGGNLVFDARNDSSDGQYIFRGYGGGSSSEYLRINTSGNIKFKNAGQGIDFSATSGTGTSELFDDYEEGTWTPTLNAYAGTPTVSGYYVKIGQMVYVECSVALDGTSDSSGYIIDGLPFTMASPYLGGGAVNTNDGGVADALVGSDVSGRLRLRNSSGSNQTYNSIGVSSTVTLNAQYRAA